jgi:catechol 2,3-dioxygenase-like lactoylglutathione lyase family enzyme
MTPIKNLAFVMLGAADIDRSVDFYCETLGLTLSGRFGEFAFLDTGSVTLVVTGELARDGAAEACEVVFAVDSVTKAYEALKDRIAFANEPRPVNPQNWAVNFHDPDGHSLSLYGSE